MPFAPTHGTGPVWMSNAERVKGISSISTESHVLALKKQPFDRTSARKKHIDKTALEKQKKRITTPGPIIDKVVCQECGETRLVYSEVSIAILRAPNSTARSAPSSVLAPSSFLLSENWSHLNPMAVKHSSEDEHLTWNM